MIKHHYVIADRFTNQIKIKEFVHKIKRISNTAYYYYILRQQQQTHLLF